MAVANVLAEAALAVWLAQSIGSTIAVAAYRRGLPQPEFPGEEPGVAVIVPVRGSGRLAEFLPALRRQVALRRRLHWQQLGLRLGHGHFLRARLRRGARRRRGEPVGRETERAALLPSPDRAHKGA